MRLGRSLRIFGGILLAIIIAGYSVFQFQDLWRGPTISITNPRYGETISSPLTEIRGSAERIAFLYLNGRQIYTNPKGQFRETLLLSPGHNIITLSAEDKFGRTTQKQVELILPATTTDTWFSFLYE